MSEPCHICSASTTWDDSVGSAVCTSCGSLNDPSQSVLTSSFHDYHNGSSEPLLWDSSSATTLKSLRAGNNWDLAGQGKESRERKNSYAIAEFIKSLAVSLNASGLSPRAIALFNQAKSANHFRWGQKSKFTAAACLAIAFRESNRPDSIRDIASILDAPLPAVLREFTSVTSTLNLNLPLVDPSVYMSTLQTLLASALQEPQLGNPLPSTLVKLIRTLCLRSVTKTALSLCQILPRLSPEHNILRLPAAPTACGLFLLAIEGEARSVLNPLGDLAGYLAARCHTSKSVVMSRYRSIQDEIVRWAEQVPWLDIYEKQGGRAKVSKRLIAARSLTDLILFQQGVWEAKEKPSANLDLVEDEDENTSASQQLSCSSRRKLQSPMSHATQFLLDPLGTSITSVRRAPVTALVSHLPLATRVLAHPAQTSIYRHPTRLQLLTLERGGVTLDHISDEDLFAEGEFERLLRSNEEVAALRETLGWTTDDNGKNDEVGLSLMVHSLTRRKRKKEEVFDRGGAPDLSSRKKSRLNMDALAKLMASHDDNGDHPTQDNAINTSTLGLIGFINDVEDDNSDGNASATYDLGPEMGEDHNDYITSQDHCKASTHLFSEQDEGVIMQHWRSPSPGHIASDCRYEEERPP